MQDLIIQLFGTGNNLTIFQISTRAFVMFFVALILIRFGGLRLFGNKSAFDNVIVIMLGAVLSRGIVGASSMVNVIAAGSVMISINRIIGAVCMRSRKITTMVEGKSILLIDDGQILEQNLKKATINKAELTASLRLETKKDSFEDVIQAYLETNGRISFILRKEEHFTRTKIIRHF
ncbi:MAG: YetF domain-containing protein [Ferruginibacter sp.]